MKKNSAKRAVRVIENVKNQISTVSSGNYETVMKHAREALFEADKTFEELIDDSSIPREMVEVLRINLHAFNLTLNKIDESTFDNGADLQTICLSFLNSFQTLLNSTERGLPDLNNAD